MKRTIVASASFGPKLLNKITLLFYHRVKGELTGNADLYFSMRDQILGLFLNIKLFRDLDELKSIAY